MHKYSSQKHQPQIIRSVSYPQRLHTPRIQSQPPVRRSYRGLFVVALAGLAIFAGYHLFINGDDGSTAKASMTKKATVIKPTPPKQLDFTSMDIAIPAAIQKYPTMDIGVSVIDIKTGTAKNYGIQNPFEAASVGKLLTAVLFLHDVEKGKNTLSQQVGTRTAEQALSDMIVKSDNTAWNDFNNGVLSHEELADYAATLGLVNYDPNNNTIIPADIAKLLSAVYQEEVLNHQHTQLLLTYMLQAKEVEYLTDAVPVGTKVYHKPGFLDDRVHDAAIVDNGKRPYALVIFTKAHSGAYNTVKGEAFFKEVTLSTTSVFSQ